MLSLLLATRNQHKTREFAELLGPNFSLRDLSDESGLPVIEETGSTFEANAILKAVAVSRLRPDLVLSDDSGLEVAALNGAPGIFSARYAGENATDAQNIARLLENLKDAGTAREAKFHCVLVLARAGEVEAIFHGAVRGRLTNEIRGRGGFGYDPIFVPEGYEETMAELRETKNRISHRAQAAAQLRSYLEK